MGYVSVQGAPAILCAAKARDLVLLDRELVVICDLLIDTDRLFGVNDDLLLGLYGDDFGIAIGLRKRRKKCTQVSWPWCLILESALCELPVDFTKLLP